MIRKIGACLTAFVVAMSFTPGTVVAASSSKAQTQKIKKTFKQLKKLPNRASPVGRVDSLAKKLFKLDPKKTVKYYRIATQKYPLEGAKSPYGSRLEKTAKKELKKSGLSSKEIAKINKKVNKSWQQIPTPTPYQAAILPGVIYA